MKFPDRRCTGGAQLRSGWCGKPAEYVATDTEGLQWFCCEDHHEDAVLIPIDDWYEQAGMPREDVDLEQAERDAVRLIELLEGEPI